MLEHHSKMRDAALKKSEKDRSDEDAKKEFHRLDYLKYKSWKENNDLFSMINEKIRPDVVGQIEADGFAEQN